MEIMSSRVPVIVMALACGLIAVVLASRTEAFVPLVMWSGARSLFATEHSVASSSLSVTEFRSLYQPIVAAQARPEIVVAFVYSHMSSAEASRESGAYDTSIDSSVSNAAFASLRSAVSASKSSYSSAAFMATSPISDELTAIHATAAPEAEVFAADIAGSDAASIAACDGLLNHLSDHNYIFANKNSDLIIVKFAAINQKDQCMSRVLEHINTKTGGDFLAVFSADSATASPIQTSFLESDSRVLNGVNYAQRYKTLASGNVGATNITYLHPGITKINSSVFWGLILALIGVIAISCGVCWIQSIETPARFSSTPLVLSKEY